MPMITSAQNPRLQAVRALLNRRAERDARSAFVVEGVRLAEEALAGGWTARLVLTSAQLSERGRQAAAGFAARGADLLVLPHPTGASAELRKAIQAAVAAPPVPLLLVAHSETAQAATVESEGEARGLNGAHVLLGSLLGGKVRRIAVDAGTPAEPFRSLAPLVVETSNGSALTDDEVDPEEVYVLLNASRAKGFLRSRALARRRLSPQRNLLLVPDHRK